MDPISALRLMPAALEAVQAGQAAVRNPSVNEAGASSPVSIPGLLGTSPASGAAPTAESFSNMLGRMVSEVNAKQQMAGEAVHEMQSGGNVSLHQAVIAMEEASVSFLLMVEVRNKLLESYQELMRMQV